MGGKMYPKPVINQFFETGNEEDKDNGSYYIYLVFDGNGHFFDFSYDEDIGILLGFNYKLLVKECGGYKHKKDFFFKEREQAEQCVKRIESIIEKIYSNEDNKIIFANNFIKMVKEESKKSKRSGYYDDSIRMLDSISYFLKELNLIQ
jgi:hypothetical protein